MIIIKKCNKKQTAHDNYFTSISYMDLGHLQERSEEAKVMRKEIALLKSENSKLIKEKT